MLRSRAGGESLEVRNDPGDPEGEARTLGSLLRPSTVSRQPFPQAPLLKASEKACGVTLIKQLSEYA